MLQQLRADDNEYLRWFDDRMDGRMHG